MPPGHDIMSSCGQTDAGILVADHAQLLAPVDPDVFTTGWNTITWISCGHKGIPLRSEGLYVLDLAALSFLCKEPAVVTISS